MYFPVPFLILAASSIWANSYGEEKMIDLSEMYKNPLSHGFGDDIDWIPWEDAIETALERNKPIFLLIHKTWCHACKSLRKIMQQSTARKAFKKMSDYFVMVNTADDEEPYEEDYRPDGKYVPRILFLDRNGDLLEEFRNEKSEYKNYAYYYPSPADILRTMKKVVEHYGFDLPDERKGDKLKPKKPPPKDAPDAPVPSKRTAKEEEEQKAQKEAEIKKIQEEAEKRVEEANRKAEEGKSKKQQQKKGDKDKKKSSDEL